MNAKSTRHRQNQKAESRLLDHDPVEQRALQIARDEGRDQIDEDDRQRARTELNAPNAIPEEPEITPGMEQQITAWDEAPGSSGKKTPKIEPDDEASIGKELVEHGLPGTHEIREGGEHRI